MERTSTPLTTEHGPGVALIAAERLRQILAEGYLPEDDRAVVPDHLAQAGACYAMPESLRIIDPRSELPFGWPFGASRWKPNRADRVRELTKAGALIAAELDALLGTRRDS